MSVFHLFWIAPLCAAFGFMVGALLRGGKKVRTMTEDELAVRIYEKSDDIMDEVCNRFCLCSFGDDPTRESCIACVKRWLKEEIQ